MENSIRTLVARWNVLRASSFVYLLLTLALNTVASESLVIEIATALAAFLGSMAILRSDWLWARGTFLALGLSFFMALFSHGLSGSVSEKLPILLLSLVSVLFSVEILSLICRYGRLFSTRHVVLLTSSSVLVLEKAMMQATTTLRRTGLVFASCYLIAVAAIYMGGLVATAVPVFTDISLYLVAVTISLALLIILREE